MEFALPHVVVRSCGPGVGPDLVAALNAHPIEVSEARDMAEARRVAAGRPASLVVVVATEKSRYRWEETHAEFRETPILLVTDSPNAPASNLATARGWIKAIPHSLPLADICWQVLDSISQLDRLSVIAEHPIGPRAIAIDGKGVVDAVWNIHEGWLVDGYAPREGDSLLPMIEPNDRGTFVRAVERSATGEVQFVTVRILDCRGRTHVVQASLRSDGGGRITLLLQPLLFGGPIAGRHVNTRDPLTGLFNRWAMSRILAEQASDTGEVGELALLVVKLDEFVAIGDAIGFRQTDVALVRVASALTQAFPWPAVCCRASGATFHVFVAGRDAVSQSEERADRLISMVSVIDLPGFQPGFRLGVSVGIARVTDGDHDLAIRGAEAAVGEAYAAGGSRKVVAGSPQFTRDQAGDMLACMDLGKWEVWLQAVVRPADGRVDFYEALARFNGGGRHMASRADFFAAGRAEGLLARFDRMMMLRAVELAATHPDLKLSVNVTCETFGSDSCVSSVLDACRQSGIDHHRIILEIAPHCLSLPATLVGARLSAFDAAGIAVAIDDFGSGICRVRDLTQFPVSYVKLDEVITSYIGDDPLQRDFVRTVTKVCRARGIMTVAEYTRSPEQMAMLVEDGVDLFQGELFGMPRPATEVLVAASPAG